MVDIIRSYVIPAAYRVLPPVMASDRATAMLMAMGWQESKFLKRVQTRGPAKGLWQFEQRGGVTGVLGHRATADIATDVLNQLGYQNHTPFGVYCALEHNDILACAFARLLLWTLPSPLPQRDQMQEGWRQYTAAWRPGKPHVESWPDAWRLGWAE